MKNPRLSNSEVRITKDRDGEGVVTFIFNPYFALST